MKFGSAFTDMFKKQVHLILSEYIQIWHFYRTSSRGSLFSLDTVYIWLHTMILLDRRWVMHGFSDPLGLKTMSRSALFFVRWQECSQPVEYPIPTAPDVPFWETFGDLEWLW